MKTIEQKTDRKNYVLKVGNAGAPRLALLNDMLNPATLAFIEQHIDLPNKTILDLGCGVGILSAQLAKRSLPNGCVVAADISEAQLEVAKSIARENNISNIFFKQISAFDIDQLEQKFDLIYCRFMFAHLACASEIIEKITQLMHPTSIFICEEPNDIYSLYCKPAHPLFEQFKKAAIMQVEVAQSDFSIGKKLHSIFLQNNLKVLQEKQTQGHLSTPALKQQLWLGMTEVKSLLLENKFASEDEIDQLIIDLKSFANDSETDVFYFEHTQIAGAITPGYSSKYTKAPKMSIQKALETNMLIPKARL